MVCGNMLALCNTGWCKGTPVARASRCKLPSIPPPCAVHVEACNTAAAALYLSSGFKVEREETEAVARALNRNRRLLLHIELQQGPGS